MSLVAPFPQKNWSSPFGEWPQWRKDMGLGPHRGMDFNGLPEGTPIPCSGAGRVTSRGYSTVLGYWVVVYYPSARVYFGYCHLKQEGAAVGTEFTRAGGTVGLLGNTGSATTGAHLHLTASKVNGNPGTVEVIDPAAFFATSATAGGTNTDPLEEDDMFEPKDRERLNALYAGLFGVINLNGKSEPTRWNNFGGGSQQTNYGLLPIVIHNQNLIVAQSGRIAALEEALKQVSGGKFDPAAITAAAEAGVKRGFEGIEFPTVDAIADAVVDEQAERLNGGK